MNRWLRQLVIQALEIETELVIEQPSTDLRTTCHSPMPSPPDWTPNRRLAPNPSASSRPRFSDAALRGARKPFYDR